MDYLLPLILGLLMDEFFVHDGDHLVGFGVGLPPTFFSAITSFLNRLPLELLLLIVFFDADIAMDPINLVLLALVSVRSGLLMFPFG